MLGMQYQALVRPHEAQASRLHGAQTVTNSPRLSQFSKGQILVEDISVDQTGARSHSERASFPPAPGQPIRATNSGEQLRMVPDFYMQEDARKTMGGPFSQATL